MSIHLHRTAGGQFLVRYRAENGKILAHSELVKRRASAYKNMFAMSELLRSASGLDPSDAVTLTFTDHTGGKPVKATCTR